MWKLKCSSLVSDARMSGKQCYGVLARNDRVPVRARFHSPPPPRPPRVRRVALRWDA
jgi:hypothetical protein